MRGYSIISDEERAQILNTHRSFYDGYATGNVPSNQTPLTVEDLAQDKNGLQVSNTGEVKQYNNHIHESAEVKEYSALDMDVSDVVPAFNFVSDGPGLGETVEGRDEIKMDKESAWLEFLELNPSINSKTIHGARKHFEDMWSKTNMSEEEGHDHEIKEQAGIKFSEDIVFPDVRGWKRPNKGLSNREETAVMYKKDNVTVTFRQNQADENKIEISVVGNDELKEKLAGSIKRNELQDKINIFKQWSESLKEEVVEEEMCEQCGSEMVEGECMECGMYEEIDEDLHEAFKTQRETILENFNRFKKFN